MRRVFIYLAVLSISFESIRTKIVTHCNIVEDFLRDKENVFVCKEVDPIDFNDLEIYCQGRDFNKLQVTFLYTRSRCLVFAITA